MLTPRFIYSNSVRRHLGPMTGEEALLLERLERQRQTQRRVRAYVADPEQKFTRILLAYIQWLQQELQPGSDAIIDLPKMDAMCRAEPRAARAIRAAYNTARAPFRSRGQPHCVLQCLILDADRISPSRPLYDSRLDLMYRDLVSWLPTRCDSVLILVGDPFRRRRNRYRHFWQTQKQRAEENLETPYQLIDPADPASALTPKELHPPARQLTATLSPEEKTLEERERVSAKTVACRAACAPNPLSPSPAEKLSIINCQLSITVKGA